MLSPTPVLLLRDGRWPLAAGVCCWRRGLATSVEAAGAAVTEAQCPAALLPAPAAPAGRGPRLPWLPAPVRRPLVVGYRMLRAAGGSAGRLRRAVATRRTRSALAARLATAGLVVAESPEVAEVAIDCGVRGRRLWVLALPVGRLFHGDPGPAAVTLARIAPLVGGFLAESEPARESVERVAASHRTRVELFPPVAADRACPECSGRPEVAGADVPEPVAHLGWLRSQAVEPAGPRVPAPRTAWDGSAPTHPGGADPGTAEWTAAAQVRTSRVLLDLVAPRAPRVARPRRSVLLSGYDLKFARDLAVELDRRPDLSMTVDDWPDLGVPGRRTAQRLRTADSIFAEWARTSAVWLSQRKRPDQFLAVRLHRFELDSAYPRQIAVDNLDAVVYIAPLFGRRIRDELGWPVEKLVYIPNYIDLAWYDRPKWPEARFALGFVGMEWSRKRFDLALDLLAALRREDHRFRLVVRSVMPWQNEFVWARPAERRFAGWCFDRIERDPALRDSVIFDTPGGDMARWYRRVGHLLSTSDEEGSHASVTEAMASGAVPVVRAWPGAAEVYDKEWVHATTDEAVAAVLTSTDQQVWQERAARARAEVRRTHDPEAVVAAWAALLHRDLAGAARPFAEQQLAPHPELEEHLAK